MSKSIVIIPIAGINMIQVVNSEQVTTIREPLSPHTCAQVTRPGHVRVNTGP